MEGPLGCKVVVIHAAPHLAAGRGRLNGVNYFNRKTHGRHTKQSPQRSATPGMGRSFSLRLDVQSPSDSQVRKSAAREAQVSAQNPLHRKRQWLRPWRPGSSKGTGEGWLGLVRRYVHGRGHRGSPERCSKADPGAHEFRAWRRIPAGGLRPYGSDSSLRTIGVTESGGGAARR